MEDFLGAGRGQFLRLVKWQERALRRSLDATAGLLHALQTPTQLSGWASGVGKLLEACTDNWWDLYAFYDAIWRKHTADGIPVLLFVIDQVAEATDTQNVSIPWNVNADQVVCSPLTSMRGKVAGGHLLAKVDDVTSALRVSVVNLANFPAKEGQWIASVYENRMPPPKTPLANVIVTFLDE